MPIAACAFTGGEIVGSGISALAPNEVEGKARKPRKTKRLLVDDESDNQVRLPSWVW